jgi:hypothetical protein
VAQQPPQILSVEPDCAHALPLRPVRALVPDQAVAVEVLGQDEDAHRRQADACVAGGAQEPADYVGRWARGHLASSAATRADSS